MKKIILLSAVLLVAFSSCKDSFLDQGPIVDQDEREIYQDANRIEATLSGLYTSLKHGHFMGGKTYMAMDIRGNDIYNITANNILLRKTGLMDVTSADTETINTWYYAYLAINRTNIFMQSLEEYECETLLGSTLYNQYIAGAKFVRAMCYYYLSQLYSQPYVIDPDAKAIPLRLTANKGLGSNDCPRSSISKIYAQILDDIDDTNMSHLPKDDAVYASQSAVHMLRMRIYMAMEMWPEAIKEGEAISGYKLIENVANTFRAPYYTDETIFSLPMTVLSRPNTQQSAVEYYGDGDVLLVDFKRGILSKEAYASEKDSRVTAFIDKEDGKLLKFTETTKIQWVPVFRYAETLLNLAECYVYDNKIDLAQNCLNQVRSRSIANEDDPIDVTTLTGDELLTAIENEKRLEFIGEGISGIELIRKGKSYVKTGSKADDEISVTPSSYTWAIPTTELSINNMIND